MDHLSLPTISPNGHLQAIVEIPAGTNTKFEYDKKLDQFIPNIRSGQVRKIDFMPYPVNYGFVPSTCMDKERGGDGDPLDVLLLAENIPTGSVVEIIPIGLLQLKDLGELDHKILAIPVNTDERIIKATNWMEFQQDYSAIRHILELFFLYYDGLGTMTLMGWADEIAAMHEVEKWKLIGN
jgi:inorganic pyrophosphatase